MGIFFTASTYVNDLEAKAENNLLDDNVFSEDFIKNLLGLQNGIDIVSYGNSLFDRLIKLKIDEDILYKQFSVKLMCMNYYEVYIF
mgnify:CR=1 FL=1